MKYHSSYYHVKALSVDWVAACGVMCADLLVAGDKYEAVSMDNGYNKYMMLKIRSVSRSDFGSYQCVAKNSLGETDGLIKLDGNILSHFKVEIP